jgi:hypothetical protein
MQMLRSGRLALRLRGLIKSNRIISQGSDWRFNDFKRELKG